MHVGVLAYPGCFASEVHGVPDLLTMAGHVAEVQGASGAPVEVGLVSPRRRVIASGGARLDVRPLRPCDLLVVPGFELAPYVDLDGLLGGLGPEVSAVRDHAATGSPVVSICVGAFLLGEAGLLAGRSATTSWLYADRLARRYPGADVVPDQLVVTDTGVTTTAAFSAMYDFALELIRGRHGEEVARATARIALVEDSRTGQAPYVEASLLPPLGAGFAEDVQRWLEQRLGERYDLGAVAEAMHVSTRTMLRRFRDEAGTSPLAYLQGARVRVARHLLETTDRTVASIAAQVGYRDAGTFVRVFNRHVGERPRDYRAHFRGRLSPASAASPRAGSRR